MKPKAILLNNRPHEVSYVFSEVQLARIAELVDLHPGIVSEADLMTGNFRDTEIVFSTWGIPCLTEQTVAKQLPRLKAVFYAAGATDHFARPMFVRGVRVFSAWQANAIPVAEFCVAQILLALKGYFRNIREVSSSRNWSRESSFTGPGCYGEGVALIGAGAIAAKTQELLKAFDVNVMVIPSRPERRVISLEEAFRSAFVISNHLPDRTDNTGVLNGALFRSMRPGAVFINTGRGAQVNEAEMIQVFRERPDLTALLDVTHPEPPPPDSPLYSLSNILISSHIAGSINDEVHRMAAYMIEELESYLTGSPQRYEVRESLLLTS